MGMVERSVKTLKEIVHKNPNLSLLLLDEQIFAVNAREDGETGSNNTRIYGRGGNKVRITKQLHSASKDPKNGNKSKKFI